MAKLYGGIKSPVAYGSFNDLIDEGFKAEIIKQIDLPGHVTIFVYEIKVSKYAVNDIYAIAVDNNQDEAVYYVTTDPNEIDKLVEKTIKELEKYGLS